MHFVSDSSINKASFKHNLHVIAPGLDFFPFVVFSNLICSYCFHFLVYVLMLNFESSVACLYWRQFLSFGLLFIVVLCVAIRFLADWRLVQSIFLMNCLLFLLPGKLHFLPYILLLPGGMFVSFCSYMIHLQLFYCCLLVFCCGFLLLFQCLSCSCSLILNCFCLNIFSTHYFLQSVCLLFLETFYLCLF